MQTMRRAWLANRILKGGSLAPRFIRKSTVILTATAYLLMTTSVTRGQDSLESSAMSAAGVSSTSSATQPTTFWTLIAQLPAVCKACKAKCCASCCGQMMNEMTKPLSLMTGGCIQCCPDGPASQNPNTPGAVGAAAALAKCLEEAPQRIAAVRFIATADCGRFPEVQKELIQALRGDCSECVRFEAAIAFGMGCCCSKAVMFSLEQTVTGGTKDGFPRENSPRVKQAALVALERCQASYEPDDPVRPEEPVPPETPATPGDAKPASPIPATPPETPVPPAPAAKRDLMIRPVGAQASALPTQEGNSTLPTPDAAGTKIVGHLNTKKPTAPKTSLQDEKSLFSVVQAARARETSPAPTTPAAPPRGLVARLWKSNR